MQASAAAFIPAFPQHPSGQLKKEFTHTQAKSMYKSLILPMVATPFRPSKKETAAELALKSLEKLLPAITAYLCMYDSKYASGGGIQIINLAANFNNTFGSHEQKVLKLQCADSPFIFQADVPAVVNLLSQQGNASTSTSLVDKHIRVKSPFSFLTLAKRQNVGFGTGTDSTVYETAVPTILIDYILENGGRNLKCVHAQTGVACLIRYRERRASDTPCMQTVRLFFGNMPEAVRADAANDAIDILRQIFVRLYDDFASHLTEYVYPPPSL